MRLVLYIFTLLLVSSAVAQSISMEFPAFAGKTYDFIIFQGSKGITVQQSYIPENGKFTLTVPQQYAPYTGMCRWLLTNSETGGGIDMAIPGHDFAIACMSATPDNDNIIYTGFDAVNELNRIYGLQQKIIDKFETINKALQLYDSSHPLYASFLNEQQLQIKAYDDFHKDLKNNTNFNARFLPIVNLINGHAHRLTDNENEKALLFNEYIMQYLSIEDMYVSGHWEGIIQSWVVLQINVVNDKNMFAQDFKKLSNRISNPAHYTDFVGKLTFYLTQYGKDDYVDAIASTVVESGKVSSYEGKTMEVYVKAIVGIQAPDLIITTHEGKYEDHHHKTTIIKSKDFAQGKMNKTLLVFYQSGCGPCEVLLQQLPGNYELLKKKGIDIIAISADEDQQIFENTSRNFPWSRTYCDLHGKEGINFKNYAVIGTPMLYLIDKTGKNEKRLAGIEELLKITESAKL